MSVAPEGAWMNSPKVPRVPPPQHVRLFLPREFLALERRMLGTPVPPWATFCRPPRGASARNPPFRKGGAPEKARQTAKNPRAPRTFFQMRALSRRARAPWATNSAGKTSGLPPDNAPSGRPELQEPTFRAERERWGTRKSQKLRSPGTHQCRLEGGATKKAKAGPTLEKRGWGTRKGKEKQIPRPALLTRKSS
jgi:hypothetical protein